jgi:PRTRC genetic system protein A
MNPTPITNSLSSRDHAIQSATPLLMQPHDGQLEPVRQGSKRLVATASGMQIHARTRALDIALTVSGVPMPYGPANDHLHLCQGRIPVNLMREFVQAARTARTQEVAAAIVHRADRYALVWPPIYSSSDGHVRYDDSAIDDDDLVIDLHSHGTHKAYFSATDDASDMSRRGPYVAVVVGQCDTPTPVYAARLVLPPYLVALRQDTVEAMFT